MIVRRVQLRGLRSKVQDSFHSSLHAEEVLTKKIEKGTPIQAHVAEALGMQTELEVTTSHSFFTAQKQIMICQLLI